MSALESEEIEQNSERLKDVVKPMVNLLREILDKLSETNELLQRLIDKITH